MWFIILVFLTLALAIKYYSWLKNCYRYWELRNIPYVTVDSFIFGNVKNLMLGRKSLGETMKTHYDELAPHRFGGIFSFQNPILIARDPNLIKAILTRDCNYFFDRGFYFTVKDEPLTQNLFNLTGTDWKMLRNKLSPIFSLAKVKSTLPLVRDCLDELASVMNQCISEQHSVDMKDILARFSIDVISSCFFGVQSNSLRDPNSEFRRMGLKTFEMDFKLIIRQLIFAFNPQLANSSGIKSIKDDVNNFFVNLVKDTVAYRKKNGIVRPDFLNQLMNLLNEEELDEKNCDSQNKTTDIEFMAAQCFLFFLAGYETSSNASSFSLLEIAKDSTIQNRLQQEVDEMWENYEGNITYDSLQKLTFMDQVIAEAMRLYPAIPMLMRTCTENYCVPDSDFVIERGTVVYIPIYGLHHDGRYFKNPEKFDPERFSEQNKASRPQFAYLPFGEGPKICIGMRFGLMELKLLLSFLLRFYTFSVSPKMELPVKIKKRAVLVCCEGGIWLDYEKRNV